MSAEVVDSNPYSRLMALQRMGIVKNYERIRDYSIAIVVCIFFCGFLI
jgi:ubiquitin-like modifier-activating enzyme 5